MAEAGRKERQGSKRPQEKREPRERNRIGFSRMEKKYEWKDHVIFMGLLLGLAVWVNRNVEIRGLYMDCLLYTSACPSSPEKSTTRRRALLREGNFWRPAAGQDFARRNFIIRFRNTVCPLRSIRTGVSRPRGML